MGRELGGGEEKAEGMEQNAGASQVAKRQVANLHNLCLQVDVRILA